jgi:hypothetical protein
MAHFQSLVKPSESQPPSQALKTINRPGYTLTVRFPFSHLFSLYPLHPVYILKFDGL